MRRVGVPAIDEQHASLERALEAIEDAIARRLPVVGAWADFVREASEHMSFEEAMLERLGYPGLETHVASHRWVLRDLASAGGDPQRMLEERARFYRHTNAHDGAWADWVEATHAEHRNS